jgi:hypothetical protein
VYDVEYFAQKYDPTYPKAIQCMKSNTLALQEALNEVCFLKFVLTQTIVLQQMLKSTIAVMTGSTQKRVGTMELSWSGYRGVRDVPSRQLYPRILRTLEWNEANRLERALRKALRLMKVSEDIWDCLAFAERSYDFFS